MPEIYDEVERPARVQLRYLNYDGEPVEEEAEGLYAVCIQHEMDHLEGVLFIDHLSRLKRERAVAKVKKTAQGRPPDDLSHAPAIARRPGGRRRLTRAEKVGVGRRRRPWSASLAIGVVAGVLLDRLLDFDDALRRGRRVGRGRRRLTRRWQLAAPLAVR